LLFIAKDSWIINSIRWTYKSPKIMSWPRTDLGGTVYKFSDFRTASVVVKMGVNIAIWWPGMVIFQEALKKSIPTLKNFGWTWLMFQKFKKNRTLTANKSHNVHNCNHLLLKLNNDDTEYNASRINLFQLDNAHNCNPIAIRWCSKKQFFKVTVLPASVDPNFMMLACLLHSKVHVVWFLSKSR